MDSTTPNQSLSVESVKIKIKHLTEMKECLSKENQEPLEENRLMNLDSLKQLEIAYGQLKIQQIEDKYLKEHIQRQQAYETDAYNKANESLQLLNNDVDSLRQKLEIIQKGIQKETRQIDDIKKTTSQAFDKQFFNSLTEKNKYNVEFIKRAIESEEILHRKSYTLSPLWNPY